MNTISLAEALDISSNVSINTNQIVELSDPEEVHLRSSHSSSRIIVSSTSTGFVLEYSYLQDGRKKQIIELRNGEVVRVEKL